MKKRKPNALEVALQAHITSVQTATQTRDDAIQLAEDAHYSEIAAAKKVRHEDVVAVEKIYDAAVKIIEKAWMKVFRGALRGNFRDTRKATQADRAAIRDEALLQKALPFIRNEVPSTLPGLAELIASTTRDLEARRVETGENLSSAHDNAAREERKLIPEAKRKRASETAKVKRRLKKAKDAVEKRFQSAEKKADTKLRKAKEKAQAQFDKTSAARKAAWAAYAQVTQTAEQSLLASLLGAPLIDGR